VSEEKVIHTTASSSTDGHQFDDNIEAGTTKVIHTTASSATEKNQFDADTEAGITEDSKESTPHIQGATLQNKENGNSEENTLKPFTPSGPNETEQTETTEEEEI
ncbi:unnamed protein product, partial [Dicrocoelium dendriticum]